MKLKKYESTENKAEVHNTQCIVKVMGMNGLQNQGCLMQKM